MSPGQMLHRQMPQLNLECVLDVPSNLPLKFCQNWVSNSRDIPNIEFVCGGGGGCKVIFT